MSAANFIIEIQNIHALHLLFETGQALVKQLIQGGSYHLLQPVYGLGIIATNFDPTEQWHHHYQLGNVGDLQYQNVIPAFAEMTKKTTSLTYNNSAYNWDHLVSSYNFLSAINRSVHRHSIVLHDF